MMTAPATEKAAPIPAEVLTKLANDLLAIANASVRADGSDIPLGETCRKAALVLADRASQEERIRENEREACARVVDDFGVTWGASYRSMTDEIAKAVRARLRGDAS